ncbi:hypothetical protein CY34DRAFT_507016 [Suillus luteus UH-Slu-Lm8-n1]|uniref:Uncharacterized protein n=1 Tax=Suillus luteus UH-Slu-Lm8-n1 TaxID=930992 RepID=A0A0D0BRC3_9AGAM|nr:hypothetical protein CY34DRAFT_507016 [Suillus luteus UH-Slu-Lm8-n1]
MRLSSAFVLAVAAALAGSVSATPVDAGVEHCPLMCYDFHDCNTCWLGECVSFSGLRARFNHIVPSDGSSPFSAGSSSWSLSRSTFWFLQNFYFHSSDGDIGIGRLLTFKCLLLL